VLVKADVTTARREQARVRSEFKNAIAEGLVCAAFERGRDQSKYLMFEKESV
jgi:hypothetical protein